MAEVVSTMVQVHVAKLNGSGDWSHLILRRAANEKIFPGQWQVITGRIEPSESAVQTATRELSEECGLTHEQMWTLPFVSTFYSPRRDAIIAVPVFGAVVSTEAEVILSDEHEDFQWLSSQECSDRLTVPAQLQATKVFDEILSERWDDVKFREVYLL